MSRSAGSARRRSSRAGKGEGHGEGTGRRRGLGALIPQLLIVAVLVGATTAFVRYDKTVHVVVDGDSRTVHTFASDVAGVLDRAGVEVGEHDMVAPGRTSRLSDGDRVHVRYGRKIDLTLDGRRQDVWVTATNVDEALVQLGIRADGAHLSADRRAPVGRSGLKLDVRTERGITFLVDGRQVPVRTNVATVAEALEQAGIKLGTADRMSAEPDAFPTEGMTVTVLRVSGTSVTKDERIPYETVKQDDPTMFKGQQEVVTKGVTGIRRITYAYETVDGVRQAPRKIKEEIVKPPVTQVIKVGTKAMPNSVAGADDLNWGALAQCEAGGNPKAVDPSGTYHGLYQFDAGTWRSIGGTGVASQAPASEQTYRAKLLYVQRGASPWPHCGARLFS